MGWKSGTGSGIALTAALAVTAMRFATAPPAPPSGSAIAQPTNQVSPHYRPSVVPDYRGGCPAFTPAAESTQGSPPDEDRGAAISLLDTFFNFEPDTDTAVRLPSYTQLQYAIALIPDPRHTNLSMMSDRSLVIIQQAAQDGGYTYNSSWLPWRREEPAYPLFADQELASARIDHREACPGVLLFRKSARYRKTVWDQEKHISADPFSEGLVVLVVGEQPTGGLNENQWANALLWLSRNAPAPESPAKIITGAALSGRPLRILGPNFSGSLPPLERHLSSIYGSMATQNRTRQDQEIRAKFPTALILSGSVSSCSSVDWFQRRLADTGASELIDFGSFSENDARTIYRFMEYLKSQGAHGNDVAILSEDETAYAFSDPTPLSLEKTPPTAPCTFPYPPEDSPVRLSYPRDISALRSAYDAQSIFSSSSGTDHASHTVLQESAEEAAENPHDASDTIQSFSGHMTPLAQEAILYGIVGHLRVHHTRYLMLRCTNPLDFLFLTRFFHHAYPEAQIITVGADLLFGREIDSTEFRGVISLANYPLLPRNQHWAALDPGRFYDSLPHTHRTFDSYLEGSYLAARYIFKTDEFSRPIRSGDSISLPLMPFMPDFSDPFWLHSPNETLTAVHAPIWLSVVGRDGYWPLAVLGDDQIRDRVAEPPPSTIITLFAPKPIQYKVTADHLHFDDTLLLRLSFSWKICALSAMFLILYQCLAISFGSKYSSMGLLTSFRATQSSFQPILLGINSALALMLLLELISVILAVPDITLLSLGDWGPWVFTAVFAIPVMVLLLAHHSGKWTVFVFLLTILLLILLSRHAYTGSLNASNRTPLFYRMNHLTGGVSPLLPVLFLFGGFYLWTWQGLAGDALLSRGCPTLPPLTGPHATFGFINKLSKRLQNRKPILVDKRSFSLACDHFRISNEMGKRIMNIASPLCIDWPVILLPILFAVAALVLFRHDIPLLSLEGHSFNACINLILLTAFLLTTAEASRLYFTWRELRRLLIELNRLRLRRTFSRLLAVDINSLWSVSGNVGRVQYLFFAQQMDALQRLMKMPGGCLISVQRAVEYGKRFERRNARRVNSGSQWSRPVSKSPRTFIRDVISEAVGDVLNHLFIVWDGEESSLNLENLPAHVEDDQRHIVALELSKDKTVCVAEEFVCFHYIAFIQNILARMRTMVLSMVYLYVSVCLAISFYPFVPRTEISVWMIANLVLIGSAVIYVYAGMERDATLSYITNTKTGKLSAEFWLKTAGFLAAPIAGILTTQFPSIANSVLAWLQPGLDAISK